LEETLAGLFFILLIIGIIGGSIDFIFNFIFMHLPIIFGILVFFIIIYSIIKADNQKQKRLKEIEQERKLKEARFKQQQVKQEGYYKDIITLVEESINLFESLPQILEIAEKYLNQAEVDFSDGAFTPF